MSSTLKNLFLWMTVFVVVILLWNTFQSGKATTKPLDFTEFKQELAKGRVAEVVVNGEVVEGRAKPLQIYEDRGNEKVEVEASA